MEEINAFFQAYTEAECAAGHAMLRPDLDDYHRKLAHFQSFLVDELKDAMGMVHLAEPWPESMYEMYQHTPPKPPRHLFRIDRWNYPPYGQLYVLSVSAFSAILDKSYFHLFFVGSVGGKLKVLRLYFFKEVKEDVYEWAPGAGKRDLVLEKLGPPAETLRLMAPEDDEASMARYTQATLL